MNTLPELTATPSVPAKPSQGWTYRIEIRTLVVPDTWAPHLNHRGLRRSTARELKRGLQARYYVVRIVREQDGRVIR